MTNTEELIKIAIENGWNPVDGFLECRENNGSFQFIEKWTATGYESTDYRPAEIFLDKDFFIALGKGLGWYKHTENIMELPKDKGAITREIIRIEENVGVLLRYADDKTKVVVSPYKKAGDYSWKEQMHRFIDHLAEGGSIEDYAGKLLSK